MLLLFITIAVSFVLIGFFTEKNYYNPLTFFSLIWLLVVLLSSLHLYGINKPSDYAYIIIIIGTLCFGMGCKLMDFILHNYKNRRRNHQNMEDFNYNRIKVIYYITLLSFIPITVNAIELIFQGYTLVNIRSMLSLGEMHSSYFAAVIYNYITQPLELLIIPITVINFYSHKRNNIILYFTVLILICDLLSSGGRFALLYIITHFIVVMSIKKRNKYSKLTRQTKIITIVMILVGVIIFYYITVNRGVSITKSLYLYFCGCIANMDVRIQGMDNSFKTYGFMSLEGMIRPFIAFLDKAGIIANRPEMFLIAQMHSGLIEYAVDIGSGIQYNAFVTLFYYFYLDGGLLGVAIGAFVYSLFCEVTYVRMKKENDEKKLLLYLLFLQTILTSMVRFQFTTLIYSLTFIYYFVFIKFFTIKIDRSKGSGEM